MENWSEKQNETFGKLFGAIKQQENAVYKSDAITMLKLNDENFTKLFKDTTEVTGDEEDIELVYRRAIYLKLK